MIINIEKRYAYAIIGLLIIFGGLFVVNAFTLDGFGSPSTMGHSGDEVDIDSEDILVNIEGVEKTLQQAIIAGDLAGGSGSVEGCDWDGWQCETWRSGMYVTFAGAVNVYSTTCKNCVEGTLVDFDIQVGTYDSYWG